MHPRSLPIASVSHAGAQDLPILDRPRMWSILDPPPAPKAPSQQPTAVAIQLNVESLPQPASAKATKEQALIALKKVKPPQTVVVVQKSAKATADVKAFAATLSAAPSINTQAVTPVPAATTAVAATFPQAMSDHESSDSEGSLPDIDSGDDE